MSAAALVMPNNFVPSHHLQSVLPHGKLETMGRLEILLGKDALSYRLQVNQYHLGMLS
jgi:hypothetical protein